MNQQASNNSLEPGERVDNVYHYEIKELGKHVFAFINIFLTIISSEPSSHLKGISPWDGHFVEFIFIEIGNALTPFIECF